MSFEAIGDHPQYRSARELMECMVENSQRPNEGTYHFIRSVGGLLESRFNLDTVTDPVYTDRKLLIAEVGDPSGRQILASLSHADVVGVSGQDWDTDPWSLTERDGNWYGRGVCDTHGSGVAMLLAGSDPELQRMLVDNHQKISILFTYDEEAPTTEMSYRGAKLAAGLLGTEEVVNANYFIAGEPTEQAGVMTAMRSHKGRWLAHFDLEVARPGHAAEDVENAFELGVGIVSKIGEYAVGMKSAVPSSDFSRLFDPSYSTAQVTAATIKSGDYSTTPSKAGFTLDARLIGDEHERHVEELKQVIMSTPRGNATLKLEILDEFKGTTTDADSLIVKAAEHATGLSSRGFNGGDEGEVLRRAGKQGVTLGPGSLSFAHRPNEQIAIASVLRAIDVYKSIYTSLAGADTINN